MTKDKPGPLIAGLQRRLLLLLVVVLLPVFSFFVAQAWQAQRDELAHARERLLVVSRLAALGAERHVEGTRQLLNAMSSARRSKTMQSACCAVRSSPISAAAIRTTPTWG